MSQDISLCRIHAVIACGDPNLDMTGAVITIVGEYGHADCEDCTVVWGQRTAAAAN